MCTQRVFPIVSEDMSLREEDMMNGQERKRRKKGSVKAINWEAILEEELRKYSIDSLEHSGLSCLIYNFFSSFCNFINGIQ